MNKVEAVQLVRFLFEQSDRGLSDLQELIFGECWKNTSYREIAQKTGYEYNYVKRIGSQLWRSLSKALDKKVSKSNFHSLFEQYVPKQQKEVIKPNKKKLITSNESILNSKNTENKNEVSQQIQDWEAVIDVANFFGRETEISQLEDWLKSDRCRLITILGMGGIGKTTIAAKLAKQLKDEFKYVIWRSLRNAPSCIEFLDRLILSVSEQQETIFGRTVENKIDCILKYLRASRCLLIVDNAESILCSQDRLGKYREDYEGYGQLFRRIVEENHQSCLIITSREQPIGIANRVENNGIVRSLQLEGLSVVAGQKILKTKSVAESQSLVEHYIGNPLALKIAATTIESIFAGDVGEFLV